MVAELQNLSKLFFGKAAVLEEKTKVATVGVEESFVCPKVVKHIL
jgi:hypothetical protein